MRILGIDPGSRITGYGIVDINGRQTQHVHSGVIRIPALPIPERLKIIFKEVVAIVRAYQPDRMAVEQVFVNKNVDSALKLGHARAAAICAGVMENLEVDEFTPRQIKQAIVGSGGADKTQVQHMVKVLTGYKDTLVLDESDALAVALCACHSGQTVSQLGDVRSYRAGRMR